MRDLLVTPLGQLAVALGIGLVIGAERERRKEAGPRRLPAGIRTFALVALLGAVAHLLGVVLLAVMGAGIVALALVAYWLGDREDPGLTTAVALIVTYCLGAYAVREPMIALGCGLCGALVLALRTELHTVVRSLLNESELHDALLFAIAAVVILPLLPNHPIDALGVINPFRLWRLVVVFMAMSGAGYIAQRAIGPRYGLALAGFGAGFVSSAATIASMGVRTKANAAMLRPAVAGATASSVATMVQLALLIAAADTKLLGRLAVPLAAGGVTALAYAIVQTVRARRAEVEPDRGGAFKLSSALFFAGFVALLSLGTALAEQWVGQGAILVTSVLAGFVDAHAPAAALASVTAADRLPSATGELGVLLALSANAATKIVLSTTARNRAFALGVIPGIALSIAATWVAYLLLR